MSLTEQDFEYTTQKVLEETGLTMRQLDYWCTRSYIWPSINDSKGSGDPRLFSREDIARIKKIKGLIDEGFTLKAAAFKANQEMLGETS